jgi:hypothetical protein
MVKSEYYRRQADLCLQLALAHHDQRAALSLIEMAEEMMAKAEATAGAAISVRSARLAPAGQNDAARL